MLRVGWCTVRMRSDGAAVEQPSVGRAVVLKPQRSCVHHQAWETWRPTGRSRCATDATTASIACLLFIARPPRPSAVVG